MPELAHVTTRRGFIAAAGFGGVSLYGLWMGYGAAPGPLALLGVGHGDGHDHGDEHAADGAGHGAASTGPTLDEFRGLTADFVERYRRPDGSVHPRASAGAFSAMPGAPTAGDRAMSPAPSAGGLAHGHAGHAAAPAPAAVVATRADAETLDVYLLAAKWFFEPGHLRLDAGASYRFRMMAADVAHGASIQFGGGGRMIRLRPGRITEMEARFTRPGRYLVYCTVYCGEAHDFMQARIDVA